MKEKQWKKLLSEGKILEDKYSDYEEADLVFELERTVKLIQKNITDIKRALDRDLKSPLSAIRNIKDLSAELKDIVDHL